MKNVNILLLVFFMFVSQSCAVFQSSTKDNNRLREIPTDHICDIDFRYDRIFNHVLQVEQGYQDHVEDSGNYFQGQLIGTNFGITPSTYYIHYRKVPTVDVMKSLTLNQAKEITYHLYYLKFSCDKIENDYLSHLIMDVTFNHGQGIKIVQRSCNNLGSNLKLDNEMGPKTLRNINKLNSLDLYNEIKAQRLIYMMGLSNWYKFRYGWIRRVSSFNYGNI